MEKRVLKEIKKYAEERGEKEEDKVTVIKTDEVDKITDEQFTKVAGTVLVSIGAIFMNAFVPGLGSGLSQILIGIVKQ